MRKKSLATPTCPDNRLEIGGEKNIGDHDEVMLQLGSNEVSTEAGSQDGCQIGFGRECLWPGNKRPVVASQIPSACLAMSPRRVRGVVRQSI